MQIIFITGYLSRDPELSTTQGGDEVCRLNVPVKQGWGEKEKTNWYRASVWGKRAKTVAEHCRKGTKVTITGELEIGEYQGKPQYDIRVNDIDWTKASAGVGHGDNNSSEGAGTRGNGGSGGAGRFDDNLDDDSIPYMRSDGVF